jgi:N-methylhydantoinase A
MIIGIDVGGTHADGVLLDGKELVTKKKVSVDHQRLGDSVISLLESLVPENRKDLERIHLSSTLCTNAIVTNSLEDVGMFVQSGPGMNPNFLECGQDLVFLNGTIDHRGIVLKAPNTDDIEHHVTNMKSKGIDSIGIVTKFSHRNKEHEQQLHDLLTPSFSHVSMGHQISGLPNFPRRVYSTWLNAALKSPFFRFKEAIEAGLNSLEIDCPCHILKADGGTFPFTTACDFPCESIYSGPSASILGCLALKPEATDAILLDIGGTTTDISLLADGVALLEPYGVTVDGRPTLIRALNTRSVGLGGDSKVIFKDGIFTIGPEKEGPPMALGGQLPTPTDAMIALGKIEAGSKSDAEKAMKLLINNQAVEETATQLLSAFAQKVMEAVISMVDEVFSRPVYTISALLERKRIVANELITIGGPAKALKGFLSEAFNLPCAVPENYEVANAIGAARTRLTLTATLYADTAGGSLSIPEISCQETIDSHFNMNDAREKLTNEVQKMAAEVGLFPLSDIDFVEEMEMSTVRGFYSSGKIITLKAQIRPGLQTLKEEAP